MSYAPIIKPTPTPTPVTSATVGNLKYKVTGSSATVTAPKSKTLKTISIPATVKIGGKKYKVTAVKADAFKGMKRTVTFK